MNQKPYLIFRVQDLRYAIEATQIREILKLPELTPVANMPTDVIGILNYRGQVLPVIHLACRLGQAYPECGLSDSLIVLDWQGLQVGVVVNTVEEVKEIEVNAIELGFSLGRDTNINSSFLAGVATVDDEMIMLLTTEALIRQADEVTQIVSDQHDVPEFETDSIDQAISLKGFFERYCPHSTQAHREVFHQRAIALKQSLDSLEESAFSSLAVMRLGEHYFGIDLKAVKEFIQISGITPIPCCPKHIVGNMNLRGDVMTLIDIRSTLDVATDSEINLEKAIVIDVDDIVAGITVDQVCDIVNLFPESISPVPAAATSSRQDYFSGIASYQGNMLGILNFPKLVEAEKLVVNEAI